MTELNIKKDCLLDSRWKGCCCNCKNRMKLIQQDTFEHVGWACNLAHEYGEQVVHVGNFEHGICECNDPIVPQDSSPC